MSLLEKNMTKCVLMQQTSTLDEYGGSRKSWTYGVNFYAAIVLDSSSQTMSSTVFRPSDTYTVTTRKDITLKYHDVFKRLSDGRMFRATSDGTDRITPVGSVLDMRQVSAEVIEEGVVDG